MYVYSAEKNAFYPLSMLEDYAAVGAWPDDGIDVDEAVFQGVHRPAAGGETARIVERATVLGGHTTTDRRTTTRQC